ncbi:hypothetical protein IPA_06415 [Ignicoccus pacificus DSM 13166]|uniref:Helicase ATP-binding domain-containing protein n=1 Tax=Ignicoccus pacificus DSM 13166 TaxID=940294 RepID=A0A977KCV0_9CREN|nr:hypothetical protein IPA_06415 [Ignicoccus pacificus DSM 13166]
MRGVSDTLVVGPTTVAEGDEELVLGKLRIKLRKFQEEVKRTKGNVVIKAPTGSGKTLTLLLFDAENAVGVYPSRALVNDQFESLSSLFRRGCEEESKGSLKIFDCDKEKYVLLKITSESLEGRGWKALEGLCEKVLELRDEGAKSIVFTVPEYPYFLLSGEYDNFYRVGTILKRLSVEEPEKLVDKIRHLSREVVVRKGFCAQLFFAPNLFFDEFHAYSGKSLYGALALLSIYTSLPFIETRIAISSATHTPEFALAKKILEEFITIEAQKGGLEVRGKTIMRLMFIRSRWPGVAAFSYVEDLVPLIVKENIHEIRERVEGGDKVGIIVDKIANVYETYRVLKEGGVKDVVCVTSLSEELGCGGDPREASVIVGNEAISYGIDIKDLNYGLVTAKTWHQLVQRVGRFGRGPHSSELILPYPLKVKDLFKKSYMEWEDFVELSKKIYPKRPLDWYAESGLGGLKLRKVLDMYELTTYIMYRDKFKASQILKKALTRSRRILNEVKEKGELHLGALATFYFSSFRGASDELIIKARNFELEDSPEGPKINVNKPVRGYLALEVDVDEELKEVLKTFEGKVIQFNAFVELLSKWTPRIVQVIGKNINPLSKVGPSKDPIYVLRSNEGYLRYLLSVESAVGLVYTRGGEVKLLGVLVRV